MKKLKFKFITLLAVFVFSIALSAYAEEEIIVPSDPVPIPEIIVEPAPEVVEPTPEAVETPALVTFSASVVVRSGDTVLYDGTVDLPEEGIVEIPDNTGVNHSINSRSVLGILYSLSVSSGTFSLSNLEYYSSWNSLYLKCIIPTGGSELCDNWQYTVNNTTPSLGMDSATLSDGDVVGVYFGFPHHTLLSSNSINVGGTVTATAEKYNYADNTWSPLTGVTIGVTTPNPNDPHNPTTVMSQTVDDSGSTTFTLGATGEYSIGVVEDYYFPSYILTVIEEPVSSGGSSVEKKVFSVENAVKYLESVQNEDGSFGGDMYTDWATIGLASAGVTDSVKQKVLGYVSAHKEISSILSDNERRAIALLALGENPYSFEGMDYIAPILESFSGVQFGDVSLVNDDAFAIIVLLSSGYDSNNEMLKKSVSFIVSKQQDNGSWYDSVDTTSAIVQALQSFSSISEVGQALEKASTYLQNSQMSDGGFGSVYSTAWAAQAMKALGTSWTKDDKSVGDYMAEMQTDDGAVLPNSETLENRIWATSYAIPAMLSMTWSDIMHEVPKPAPKENNESKILSSSENTEDVQTLAEVPVAQEIKVTENEPTPEILIIEEAEKVADDTEQATEVIESVELVASASNSRSNVPWVVVGTACVLAGGIAILTRRFSRK